VVAIADLSTLNLDNNLFTLTFGVILSSLLFLEQLSTWSQNDSFSLLLILMGGLVVLKVEYRKTFDSPCSSGKHLPQSFRVGVESISVYLSVVSSFTIE